MTKIKSFVKYSKKLVQF